MFGPLLACRFRVTGRVFPGLFDEICPSATKAWEREGGWVMTVLLVANSSPVECPLF